MKRKRWILISLAVVVVGAGAYLLFRKNYVTLNMSFATSVAIRYNGVEVTLTEEEAEKMKNAFKGVKEKSPIPTKCGYGPIQVRFSSDEKEVVTYPGIDERARAALDSAEEGPFFYLGEEPTDYLWSLIKKYELREKWEETRQ